MHRASWWNILYGTLVMVHLGAVWANTWCVTLDGPCHLNCARLMTDLLAGASGTGNFFALNPYPEPNCLGHWLMVALHACFPAALVEKITLTLVVACAAWGFQRLVTVVAPGRPWAALLGLPFLLGYGFFMGFINFCFGVGLLLGLLAALEQWRSGGSIGVPWQLPLLALLLYLAHLSTFLVAVAFIGLTCATEARVSGLRSAALSRKLRAAVMVLALPLCLCAGYFIQHSAHAAAPARFSLDELAGWVIDGRAWVAFGGDEVVSTRVIALTLLTLALLGVLWCLRKKSALAEYPWHISGGALLIAYFILPDAMAGGSLASPRLLLLAMLFLTIATIRAAVPSAFLAIGAVLVVAADLWHLRRLNEVVRDLSTETTELCAVAPSLAQGNVVLPLNYGDNWLHSNLSNYLGAVTGAIVLDNFVATAPFAPVRWRSEALPYKYIGNYDGSNRPCVRMDDYRASGKPLITHVLTWRMPADATDSCTANVRAALEAGFVEVARSPQGSAVLYARR